MDYDGLHNAVWKLLWPIAWVYVLWRSFENVWSGHWDWNVNGVVTISDVWGYVGDSLSYPWAYWRNDGGPQNWFTFFEIPQYQAPNILTSLIGAILISLMSLLLAHLLALAVTLLAHWTQPLWNKSGGKPPTT